MGNIIYVDSLSHHGVKGMKWGVRREQRRAERAKRRFDAYYNRNWLKSYNKAADGFNSKIGGINSRYKGVKFDDTFSTKKGQQYLKEVDSMWRTEYTKALKDQFGSDLGKEYIDNAPFMNSYSEYIRK